MFQVNSLALASDLLSSAECNCNVNESSYSSNCCQAHVNVKFIKIQREPEMGFVFG